MKLINWLKEKRKKKSKKQKKEKRKRKTISEYTYIQNQHPGFTR